MVKYPSFDAVEERVFSSAFRRFGHRFCSYVSFWISGAGVSIKHKLNGGQVRGEFASPSLPRRNPGSRFPYYLRKFRGFDGKKGEHRPLVSLASVLPQHPKETLEGSS